METTREQALLLPKYDNIFKRIFSEKDIVEDFLRKVLDLPDEEVFTVVIDDRELIARTEKEKVAILDLHVQMEGKADVDIEVQVCKTPGIQQRLLFYSAKLISAQLGRGQIYSALKKTIVIVIAEFPFIDDSDAWHNSYILYDPKTNSQFTDMLQYDIVELRKLPELRDGSTAWEWAKFFTAESEEEFQMLAKENVKIDKAFGIIKELSADDIARKQAEAEEIARMDYFSFLEGHRQEGLEEGREEGLKAGLKAGRIEEKTEIAVAALKRGLSIDDIVAITDLKIEEISALRENMKNEGR